MRLVVGARLRVGDSVGADLEWQAGFAARLLVVSAGSVDVEPLG